MSKLQKSFAKAKLAKLPPEAPMIPEQPAGGSTMQPIGESDNDSSDASSTATAVPSPTRQLFARPSRGCVLLLYSETSGMVCITMLPECCDLMTNPNPSLSRINTNTQQIPILNIPTLDRLLHSRTLSHPNHPLRKPLHYPPCLPHPTLRIRPTICNASRRRLLRPLLCHLRRGNP